MFRRLRKLCFNQPLRRVARSGLLATSCVCLISTGCANISSAHSATVVDDHWQPIDGKTTASGLRVSGEELDYLASPHIGAVEVTFENTSPTWVRVGRIDLDFGGPERNERVFVPWGEDLTTWYASVVQRNQIREVNQQLTLAMIALGGAVAAGASKHDPGRALGGIATLSALGALAVDDRSKQLESVEHVSVFPESHLLAGPFSVPPELFVKKWIALNVVDAENAPCVDGVYVSYEIEGHPRERVYLRYKDRSAWQQKACARSLTPPATVRS